MTDFRHIWRAKCTQNRTQQDRPKGGLIASINIKERSGKQGFNYDRIYYTMKCVISSIATLVFPDRPFAVALINEYRFASLFGTLTTRPTSGK